MMIIMVRNMNRFINRVENSKVSILKQPSISEINQLGIIFRSKGK